MHKLRPLLPYFLPYRLSLAGGMTAIVFQASIGLLAPLVVGWAVDVLREEVSWTTLLRFALLLLGVTLAQGFFQFAQRLILVRMSRHIEYDLANDYFGQLERLDSDFYQKHATGDLMARATNDLAAVRMVCGPAIMYTTNTIVTSIGALALMLEINPSLTLLALAPLPFVALISKFFGSRIHNLFTTVQEQYSGLTAKVQENLAGARVVRTYAQEDRERELFREINEDYVQANRRLIAWDAAFRPIILTLIGIGFAAILWQGCQMILSGQLTVGQYVTFNLFLSKMVWPMIAIGWVVNLAERAAAAFERIDMILRTEPVIRDAPDAKTPDIQGAIDFRNLSFSYNHEAVLRNISLAVEAGSRVAVVGRTGSGKSTLLALIPRLLDPPPGTLRLDGEDVRHLELATLRGEIAMVPQESFLFSDTIAGNIAFARPDAPPEDIFNAARLAGLENDLSGFPRGLDTMVGERGITLSGGQKQRVALARAILRKPKILLLDDCLSAVDAETEDQILQNLHEVFPGRTVFQVSHRVSAVSNANLILVLHGGTICEQGSHDELLGQDGFYADLYRRQQLERELVLTGT